MARFGGSFGIAACVGAALLSSCGSGEKPPAPKPTASRQAPDPASLSFLPADFHATGTEPFWSATVENGQLTYVTPETRQAGGVTARVVRADGAGNALLTAIVDGQAIQLLVTPGACSDGMSDKVYPWTVERSLGDDTENSADGCAEPLQPDSNPAKTA